jgi:[ribosomal protein S18]-alanine N-acetyltransferase
MIRGTVLNEKVSALLLPSVQSRAVHPQVISIGSVNFLELEPLTADLIPAAFELDRLCLGGLWTLSGYQREFESPNSDLLILRQVPSNSANQSNAIEKSPSLETTDSPILGLGCLWAILEEAHITVLAVHPDHQRQGLGQALLCGLLVAAQRRGLEWATLEVRGSNETALALYRKFGFQEVGKRRRYYQNPEEDAVILWLKGLQKPEFQHQLQAWQQQVSDRLAQSNWQWAAVTQLFLQDPT